MTWKINIELKILPDPISITEACNKRYVDNFFNAPSILKDTTHIDVNDRKNTKARFIQVNQLSQIDRHLTAKLYVDNAIDEISSNRNNQDKNFNNNKLTNINSFTLDKRTENDNEVLTKAYVDQFHQENERSRRDPGLIFYDESSDLVKINRDNDINDKKLTNLDSITVNRNPTADDELAKKNILMIQ